MKWIAITTLLALANFAAFGFEVDEAKIKTPQQALEALSKGNERFVQGQPLNQDFHKQIEKTKAQLKKSGAHLPDPFRILDRVAKRSRRPFRI